MKMPLLNAGLKWNFCRHKHSWTLKQLTDTLNLPKTTFPQRANYVNVESTHVESISSKLYYNAKSQSMENEKVFTIHDGPPFANGDLHIGHALNKMLKDIILRMKLEEGYRIEFRPGWDCHGLPIEQKAISVANSKGLDPLKVRKSCKAFAQEAIKSQGKDLVSWGLLADFNNPVLTMEPKYEASQLSIFRQFVQKGLVYTDKRPVYWSPSSLTALAEAELEYNDGHISKACFIKFPIQNQERAYLLVWTTTPWTILANQAIAINPNINYVQVKVNQEGGETWILASSRIDHVKNIIGQELKVERNVPKDELLTIRYFNGIIDDPIESEISHPILASEFVSDETGTGMVHLAPAYGQNDFVTCRKHGIIEKEIVDEEGLLADKKVPKELYGKSVIEDDGIEACIKYISSKSMLVHTHPYQHRYPYDWRTKRPVIQMATRQWFIRIDLVKEQIFKALDKVEFLPESGRKRLVNMIDSRNEWCISRQRHWGVPIPVFYEEESGLPLLDPSIIKHVESIIAEGGSDAWWNSSVSDLLPESFKAKANCLRKGTDTLDVWFDSGTFWNINPSSPADIYIEGTDQYRGWFQSSLVSSVVTRGFAPFKKVIAHGFVLDEKGMKMSKSLGNVISPGDIIRGGGMGKAVRGTDVLRLWAASSNFLSDIQVGANSINQVTEFHQKIRNTIRFILGNLSDYDYDYDDSKGLDWDDGLLLVDRLALEKTLKVRLEVWNHYQKLEFSQGLSILQSFIETDLSSFYLDLTKNRLYLEHLKSPKRQSVQYTLNFIIQSLLALLKPILPFLWAEVTTSYLKSSVPSTLPPRNHHPDLVYKFNELRNFKSQISSKLYKLCKDGRITSTFQVELFIEKYQNGRGEELPLPKDDLTEILMVSKILQDSKPEFLERIECKAFGRDIPVTIIRSKDEKCPRCWVYRMNPDDETVCSSCKTIIEPFNPPGESIVNPILFN